MLSGAPSQLLLNSPSSVGGGGKAKETTLKLASYLPHSWPLRVGCFPQPLLARCNVCVLGRENNCFRTSHWSSGGKQRWDVSCVRAGSHLRARADEVGGWVGRYQAWAWKLRRIHPLAIKGVGWQCLGCGLRPIGHRRVKEKGREGEERRETRRDYSVSWLRWPKALWLGEYRKELVRVGVRSNCGDLSLPLGNFSDLKEQVDGAYALSLLYLC